MQHETIAARLRRLRLERGMSQRQLASHGVTYAYISRIEAGTRHPSVKALRVLADQLGVSTEYLETGRESTITDDRADTLAHQAHGELFRVLRRDDVWLIRWASLDEESRRRRRQVAGVNLTEALASAVEVESMYDALRSRAAELRAELAAVEEQLEEEEAAGQLEEQLEPSA